MAVAGGGGSGAAHGWRRGLRGWAGGAPDPALPRRGLRARDRRRLVRVEYAGTGIAYPGDTESTGSLLETAWGADLFDCGAYFFEKKVMYHLDYQPLRAQRERLECRRIILTQSEAGNP